MFGPTMELFHKFPAPSLLKETSSWTRGRTGAVVTEREGTSLAGSGVLGKSQAGWKLQPDMLEASRRRPRFSPSHPAPGLFLKASPPLWTSPLRETAGHPPWPPHHSRILLGGMVTREDSAS